VKRRLADEHAAAAQTRDRTAAELAAVRADADNAIAAARTEVAAAAERHRVEMDRVITRADTRVQTLTREHQADLGRVREDLGAARARGERAEVAVATIERVRGALTAEDVAAAVTEALKQPVREVREDDDTSPG
ncbi:MAG: hypothetical protein M3548_21730, partial [Actinomycetota bacterium]|nr:hypothetical protein [Actinomycetota bacterium]